MHILVRKITPIILSTIAVIFFTAVYSHGDINDNLKRSFAVEPGGQLTLETDIGAIGIKAVKGNTVDVEVIRDAKRLSEDDAQKILEDLDVIFDHRGKDVHILAEFKKKGWRKFRDNLWNRLRVKFIITVPLIYDVELRTSGGSISVEGVEGIVQAKTSGGSLYFDNIDGRIQGKTSGGSIKVGAVRGDVDVHTSGGSITVKDLKGALQANTSGGSVTATISQQPESDCRLTTSGGSITVYLDDDTKMDVDAGTAGGSIHTEFPVTIQGKINKRKLKATINGGGPELYLHTSGGSIYLKKSK